MKHWDGRDRTDAAELPLTAAERARLRALFEPPAHRGRARPDMGSWIGLAMAVGLLAGLVMLLAPGEPISPDLMR